MKFFNIAVFLACFAFCSCAYHHGTLTGNASLSGGNFTMLKPAYGYAQTTHVLGIGGLKKQALVHEARKNLYAQFPLEANQAYANIAVDFKRSFFPFIGRTQVFVTADIVQFQEEAVSAMPGKYDAIGSVEFRFDENDEVLLYVDEELKSGVIHKIASGVITILYEDLFFFRVHEKSSRMDLIYLSDKSKVVANSHFQVGDIVERAGLNTKVEVMGLGVKTAMVRENGVPIIVNYSDLKKAQ